MHSQHATFAASIPTLDPVTPNNQLCPHKWATIFITLTTKCVGGTKPLQFLSTVWHWDLVGDTCGGPNELHQLFCILLHLHNLFVFESPSCYTR